jgi:hypothetical protein
MSNQGSSSSAAAAAADPFPKKKFLNTMAQFWEKELAAVRGVDTKRLKTHELPLARIKKIMKSDEDVRMVSADAPIVLGKVRTTLLMSMNHIHFFSYTTTTTTAARTYSSSSITPTTSTTTTTTTSTTPSTTPSTAGLRAVRARPHYARVDERQRREAAHREPRRRL